MTVNYLALIGDIVDSRHLENREAVQQKLEQILAEINQQYQDQIKSKFLITLGDEFQGLLRPASDVYTIAVTVLERMHPVKIRFGLGYGQINTSLKESAIGMDGPAFYGARQALAALKEYKESGIQLAGKGLTETQLRSVNSVFTSLSLIRQFWSENFKAALPLLRQGLTQTQIAEATNVAQSSVSWMLWRNKWRQVSAIERELVIILDEIFSGQKI